MAKYLDSGLGCPRKSGIAKFRLGYDWVEVTFKSGLEYTYTSAGVGQKAINDMKNLANQGDCLNTYINNLKNLSR